MHEIGIASRNSVESGCRFTYSSASLTAFFCAAFVEGGVFGSVKQYTPMIAPSTALKRNASARPAFCAASIAACVPSGVCSRSSHCPTAMPAAIQPIVPHNRTLPKSRSRSGK
jgi:hypothetical protein